jgi:hypothetical protein
MAALGSTPRMPEAACVSTELCMHVLLHVLMHVLMHDAGFYQYCQ